MSLSQPSASLQLVWELDVAGSSADHAAWGAFTNGVTAYLLMMSPESGDALIVESGEEDGPDGYAPYVQFAVEVGGAIHGEVIGDQVLAPYRQMREDVAALLVGEGWSGNERSRPNWYLDVLTEDISAVRAMVSRALWVLRNEFGVASPARLNCTALNEEIDMARAEQIAASSGIAQFPEMLEDFRAFACEHLGCACPSVAGGTAAGSPTPNLPAARLVKSVSEAEEYAAKVMQSLGFTRVSTTPAGADGGIDVTSSEGLAQVKMEGLPTGRPVVQSIYGIASLAGKKSLVFSLAGYTNQAREWAREAGVALFEFKYDGSLEGRSPYAQALLQRGLQRRREARAPASEPASIAPPTGGPSLVSQLQALAELHQTGALTAAEYAAAKTKLLS